MPNAAQIGHELTEICDNSRDFLMIVIKKGPYMLRGHQFQMNVPHKAVVELILQLEC